MTDKETIEKLVMKISELKDILLDVEKEADDLMSTLDIREQFILEVKHAQDSHQDLFGEKSIVDQQKLEIIFGNGIEKGLYHILSVADLELIKKEWT